LTSELRDYIYEAHAVMPAAQRQNARWVMNLEWFNEVRKLDDQRGPVWRTGLGLAMPETLLGLPFEIRDDGGAPHLEAL
jgi:HK97 family phage major capsid protein